MTADDDLSADEAAQHILRQLIRLEMAGERTTIEIGPYSLYMAIAVCQMTARRFPPDDIQAVPFLRIAATMEPYFEGTAAGDLIAAGWRDTDVEREKKRE